MQIRSLDWEDPLEKGMANNLPPPPHPEFLPGEFHGQRSLAGYSPWGGKELDTFTVITSVSQSKAKLDTAVKMFCRHD